MGPLTAFVAWTVSSYACYQLSKIFLINVSAVNTHGTPVTMAATLAVVHMFFCWLLTTTSWETNVAAVADEKNNENEKNERVKTSFRVAVLMHVLSTFLTNWSLARTEAASTLAIKLMEPLVSALAQWVWHGERLSCSVWVSLPLVIGGAVIFVSDELSHLQHALSAGVGLAMGSNVLLAVRNLAIKELHSEQLNLGPRRLNQSVTCLLAVILGTAFTTVWRLEIVDSVSSLVVTSLLLSGAFHVTYSLISTSVILRALDVVSHAMANVIKRLLVVALLYVSGSRSASFINAGGLTVTAVGLAVYVGGKAEGRPEMWCKNTSMNLLKGFLSLKIPTKCTILTAVVTATSLLMLWGSPGIYLRHQLQKVRSRLENRPADYDHISQHLQPTAFQDTSTQNETLSPFGLRWPTVPPNATLLKEWGEFLSLDYTRHPFDTDHLAPTLHTNEEVVWEIQRLHVRVLTSLLAGRRHAMLMDFATYENKGDPAITAGQVSLLKRLNVTIVFSCSTGRCNNNLQKAREISKSYNSTSLIILLQGDGNLVGYRRFEHTRKNVLTLFPDFRTILFSQGVWLNGKNEAHLNKCREIYSHRENLTIFLRDRQSLGLAQKLFPGTKLMLMPDMTFLLGRVSRTMPPAHDIVWLKRGDTESLGYKVPERPTYLSVSVGDWGEWKTNQSKSSMETAFLNAFNAMSFLQRGRVVITDRLHGHILSVLLGIPHVLIDNPPYFKLSSFRRSWTAGLSNTVLVTTAEEALDQAQRLLKKNNQYLPSVVAS